MPKGHAWNPTDWLDPDIPPRLLAAAFTARDRALIAVLYYVGLRAFEAAALDVADVDLPRKRLHLRTTKGDKPAVLFIGRKLFAELTRYLPGLDPTGPLFPSRNRGRNGDRHITRWTVWDAVKRTALRAELNPDDLWPHLLRHGFITHLLEAGVGIKEVRDAARHSNLSTTDRYAQANWRRLENAFDAI